MRRFKYIPTNTIFKEVFDSSNTTYYREENNKAILPQYIVEAPNSKDWGEIIDTPAYTILAFKNEDYILNLNSKNLYCLSNIGGCSLEYGLKWLKIYSVRRESDGVVFTIGDKVKNCIITDFKIYDCNSGIEVHTENNDEIRTFYLSLLEKKKQPLLVTEDNIEKYEGDPCFVVAFYNVFNWEPYMLNHIDNLTKMNGRSKSTKYFHSRKEANEYILMNKPCLSINDLQPILYKYICNSKRVIPDLIELVKTY